MHDALPHIALAHAIATLLMTGVIWFVQVVHYPLMRLVPEPVWTRYELAHQRRISVIVIPLMMIELAAAIILCVHLIPGELATPTAIAGGLLLICWASTFFVQVPLHRRLETTHDDDAIRRLVSTNWLRTAAWSARSVLAIAIMLGVLAR